MLTNALSCSGLCFGLNFLYFLPCCPCAGAGRLGWYSALPSPSPVLAGAWEVLEKLSGPSVLE